MRFKFGTMALKIQCFGRVQGVFFRASTVEQAAKIGIKGWVRNEADGSVLIHAEGNEAQLAELIAWCKIGPEKAVVNEVKAQGTNDQGHGNFEVYK